MKKWLLAVVLLVCLPCTYCLASEEAKPVIMETTISADEGTAYVSNINGEVKEVAGYLAGRQIKDITYEKLSGSKQNVKTLVLVDASNSIKKDTRKKFRELLNSVVDKKMKNESFSVACYGKKVSYLCEYSKDRFEIMKAYDAIEYKKQNTYTNQIVYDLVKEFYESSEKCFRRILLFNDGQDGNKDGVTKQELLGYLDEHSYPILIIGCQNEDNADSLKELFAISREVKTDYFTFTSKSDIRPILNAIQKVNSYEAVVFPLSRSDSDGSVKSLSLEISLIDGTHKVAKDIRTKMDTDDGKTDNKTIFIVLCSVIGAIAVITIIIILVKMKKRKKAEETIPQKPPYPSYPQAQMPPNYNGYGQNQPYVPGYHQSQQQYAPGYQQPQQQYVPGYQQSQQQYAPSRESKTAFIPRSKPVLDQEQTVLLHNNGPASYTLQLTNQQTKTWYAMEFTKELIVGRDRNVAGLAIPDDRSVSKKHFKVTMEQGEFYIEDLNSSNHTIVNGTMITSKVPIRSGDMVTIGRGNYLVSIEKNGGSN